MGLHPAPRVRFGRFPVTATVTRIHDAPSRLWRETIADGFSVVAELATEEQIDDEQIRALIDAILFGTPTMCRREAWKDYREAYENLRSLREGADPRSIDPDITAAVSDGEAVECLTRQFEREMADAIELALRGRP